MLGVAMMFLGNSILGNLNKEATSQKSLGLPFWRLVIGSGIVVLVMGAVNILAVRGAGSCQGTKTNMKPAELCFPRRQSTPHGASSPFSRCGCITQSRCRGVHAQTPQSPESLSVIFPRQQTRFLARLPLPQEHRPQRHGPDAQDAPGHLESVLTGPAPDQSGEKPGGVQLKVQPESEERAICDAPGGNPTRPGPSPCHDPRTSSLVERWLS